jgi:hypothetical protein
MKFPGMLHAQNFQYKAKVNTVAHTAFYKIIVKPDVSARSQLNFEDLRLFDNAGKEIPYLLNREVSGQSETQFVTYPLTSAIEPDRQTIIIENKDKRQIDKFVFAMKNADASRLVRISGSEDKTNWYVVRDSFYFESYSDVDESIVKKALKFPGGDYSFYKVEITRGSKEAPFNILNVGNYSTNEKKAAYQRVSGLSFTRTDSNKVTRLQVKCTPGNRIDKLVFSIAGPEMYHRSLQIIKPVELAMGNSYSASPQKTRYVPSTDSKLYELSSDRPATIICGEFLGYEKQKTFTIEIQNLDDQPLQIKGIEAYQLTSTIRAKLEKDKNYFLYFGDSLLDAPAYDIVYFSNNLPTDDQTIEHQQVLPKGQKVKDEYDNTKDQYIVWIGLGLAAIIILVLTLNMMKKMKKD